MPSEAALAAWPDSQALSLFVKDGLVCGQEAASSTSRSSPVHHVVDRRVLIELRGRGIRLVVALCHWKALGAL